VQAEGLELMQLILKEKRVARVGSLKVLDFATTRCPPACERWVDLTGLKQLFAIFMGKSKVLQHCTLIVLCVGQDPSAGQVQDASARHLDCVLC